MSTSEMNPAHNVCLSFKKAQKMVQVCLCISFRFFICIDVAKHTIYLEICKGKEPTSRSQATMFPSKKGSRPVS